MSDFSATVHVNILDDNDNYPQFSEKTYTVTVDEDINVSDNPVVARIKWVKLKKPIYIIPLVSKDLSKSSRRLLLGSLRPRWPVLDTHQVIVWSHPCGYMW